jgi:hypothetical protein
MIETQRSIGLVARRACRPALSWECVEAPAGWEAEELRREWRRLVERSDHPYALYQSPEWFDHMVAARASKRLVIAVGRDERDRIVAVVPIRLDRHPLQFHILRDMHIGTSPLLMAYVMGGQPLGPPTDEAYAGLLAVIENLAAEAVGLSLFGVRVGSAFHQFVTRSPEVSLRYYVYARPGLDGIDLIPLPPTFDEFLGQYNAKKRYNLRRQLRQLREHTGDDLRIARVESADQVRAYLDALAALRRRVDRGRRLLSEVPADPASVARHRDIADRGLLRCYLLSDGDRPIACIHGKQHREVFVVDFTLYDPEYEKFSPGTTALYLAIEDLLGHRPVRLINLGYGAARHEFRSTGMKAGFRALWLVRKNWQSRLLWAGRMMMRGLGRSLKWAGVELGLRRGKGGKGG